MGRFFCFSFICIMSLLIIFPGLNPDNKQVKALPLSADSRWIVDESGSRVKLACVNWVSHLDAMVAEGLNKQPVDVIAKKIVSMGFNCVRLTWPLYLLTNDSLASLTVRQSFQNLGLNESIAGVEENNPSIIDLPRNFVLVKGTQESFCSNELSSGKRASKFQSCSGSIAIP